MALKQQKEFIVLYGSLMQRLKNRDQLNLAQSLNFHGQCKLKGRLYDLGAYPGLVLNKEDIIYGELYKIVHPKALNILDEYERFDDNDSSNSLYIRRCIQLVHPKQQAWVYVYNGDTSKKKRVESGSWRQHLIGGADGEALIS